MSEHQPPASDGDPGEPSGPHGEPSNPQAQSGFPAYPGSPQQDLSAYGQQPSGMPPLANWGWRALSWVIDAVLAAVVGGVIGLTVNGAAAAKLADLAGLVIVVIYTCMEGATGQTPGKKLVGTHTLRESDGRVLGIGRALARRLLHIVDMLPLYLGFLWPAWDAKRQTFADKIVSSVVIKL